VIVRIELMVDMFEANEPRWLTRLRKQHESLCQTFLSTVYGRVPRGGFSADGVSLL
jgi:hypothetical protein